MSSNRLTIAGIMLMAAGAAALIAQGAPAPAAARGARGEPCLPRDEAAQAPDFFSFRAQLQMAVARRDRAAVLAVTDPKIRTSFGPDDGLARFERDLADPAGDTWRELASVLALGGTFDGPDTFVAPYTFACGEAFEDVIVIGSDVNVRAKPSAEAPVVAQVHFAVLKGSVQGRPWAEVTLDAGRKGFIAAQFVREPAGYRAFFEKVAGRWRLITFIAGD